MAATPPDDSLTPIGSPHKDGRAAVIAVHRPAGRAGTDRRSFLGGTLSLSAAAMLVGTVSGCGEKPESAGANGTVPEEKPARGNAHETPTEGEAAELGRQTQDRMGFLRADPVGPLNDLPKPAHCAAIVDIAVSPDRRYIATYAADRTFKLWDRQQAKLVTTMVIAARPFGFSPDSRFLVYRRRNRSLDENRADERTVVGGRTGRGLQRDYLADQGSLRVYDLAARRECAEISIRPRWLYFGRNGQHIVLAGHDGRQTGIFRVPFPGGKAGQPVSQKDPGANWSSTYGRHCRVPVPALNALFYADDDAATLASVARPGKSRTAETDGVPVSCVAVGHSGRVLAAGLVDGTVTAWCGGKTYTVDVLENNPEPEAEKTPPEGLWIGHGRGARRPVMISGPGGRRRTVDARAAVRAVAVTDDGKTIFTGGPDGRIGRWRAGTETIAPFGHHPGAVEAMELVDDLLVTGDVHGYVRLWDISRKTPIGRLYDNGTTVVVGPERTVRAHRGPVDTLTFTPDGKHLLAANAAGVKLWNVFDGDAAWQHRLIDGAVALSSDGNLMARVGLGNGTLAEDGISGTGRSIDILACRSLIREEGANKAKVLRRYPIEESPGHPSAIVFSPDGHRLIVVSEDGVVSSLTVSGKPGRQRLGRIESLVSARVNSDGSVLVFRFRGGEKRSLVTAMLDLSTGRMLGRISNLDGPVAIGHRARFAAGTRRGRTVLLKRGSSGFAEIASFGLQADVVGFTPDGAYCIGCVDDQMWSWRLTDGRVVAHTIRPTLGNAKGLLFTPDSKQLILCEQTSSSRYEKTSEAVLYVMSIPAHRHVALFKIRHLSVGNPLPPETAVHCSSGHRLLALGSEDGEVSIWDLARPGFVSFLFDRKATDSGVDTVTGEAYDERYGRIVSYSLPCGSPLPSGATCTCNCVSGSWVPRSNRICTCDLVCTCQAVSR